MEKGYELEALLRYAILAPSTHNSQPWLFRIEGRSCKIYHNPSLRLPEADPLGRDLYISMGCTIENLVIAARNFGFYSDIIYQLSAKDNLVAEINFRKIEHTQPLEKQNSVLFNAISKRINVRGEFVKKEVPADMLESLRKIAEGSEDKNLRVDFITMPRAVEKIAALTADGIKIAYRRPSFRKEMSRWVHSSFTKKLDGLPGYSLCMPALLSLVMPIFIRFFNLGKILSYLNYKSIVSAPLIVVISAKENSPRKWLEVGRIGERLMLSSTALGLKNSIFVAAIEMGQLSQTLQKLILAEDFTPQFLFAAGFMATYQKQSPRRPLKDVLL